ncbi:MAG: putative metal-binding motif-containing protein, partial [Deltaproteobacteria bacterium]|nr:putative metal-binding motif-containing protein [Deltaproteobacteria bacterium]
MDLTETRPRPRKRPPKQRTGKLAKRTGELCTTLDAPNKVKTKLDCDDKDGTIFYDPTGILAPEKCNGKDDNCDGKIDNDAIDAPTWYKDADKDKYTDLSEENSVVVACEAPAGYVAEEDVADTDLSDCNDNDVASNPGESEICDTKDNDCDGFPDRGPGLICLSTAKVIIEGEWPNDHAGAPLSINFNGGTKAGLGLGVANHGGVGNVPVQAGGFFLFYGQTVAEMIAKGITTQTTVSLADADVEIVGEPGSRAGGSVAAGFANADACEDLAVGA